MFGSCLFIGKQSSSRMQKMALIISICLTMGCLGFLFKAEATDVGAYIAGQRVAYAFVTPCSFLVLLFVMEYCRFSLPVWLKRIFHSLNLLISVSVLTLPYHTLFYRSYWAIPMEGYVLVKKDYAFLHTVAVGLFALYMAAALVVAIIFTVKNVRRRSRYVWRIMIAVMVPCAVYLVPELTGSDNDFQPVAFAVFTVMMLYMTYHNILYDVDNLATKLSIGSMEEAFVAYDREYGFKGCNKKALELFPVLHTLNLDSDLRAEAPELTDFLTGKQKELRSGGRIYSAAVKSIADGRVLKLEDVTILRQYTELLQESKDQIDKDLEVAKTIQLSALPNADRVFSAEARMDLAALMVTAKEVGGDFYDCYFLDADHAAVLIADVSGKGIPAAMFMMRSKTTIKALAEEGLPVHEVLTRANAALCDGNEAGMFVTAWMGIIDLTSGLLQDAGLEHQADNEGLLAARGMSISGESMGMSTGLGMAGFEGLTPLGGGMSATAAAPMQAFWGLSQAEKDAKDEKRAKELQQQVGGDPFKLKALSNSDMHFLANYYRKKEGFGPAPKGLKTLSESESPDDELQDNINNDLAKTEKGLKADEYDDNRRNKIMKKFNKLYHY